MTRKLTHAEFISKAKLVHGDKYDYSNVMYKNAKTNVTITCPKHGDFEQMAYGHLCGKGCRVCAKEKMADNRRFSTEEFIKKAKLIHGERYDYSKVIYVGCFDKVIITCPKHGDFEQMAHGHLCGKGCRDCKYKKMADNRRFSTEKFIKKARLIHGERYDYSKVIYVGCFDKVIITCQKHGDFEQMAHSHLCGSGCRDCKYEKMADDRRSSTDEFITKSRLVHGERYDYSLVDYINVSTNVTIICHVHGNFSQTPNAHLSGHGCQVCGGGMLSNTDEFITKSRLVHGERYDYSLVDYINALTNVTIICPVHGNFSQIASSHLSGQGCPRCINKTEGLLFSILKELFPHYTILYQVVVCDDGKFKIDFHIVELNLYIELDGEQHFRQVSNWDPPEKTQAHDLTKTKRVLKEGQSLVRIYQPWVASDTNNWLEKLKANIREYEKPMVVFIGPEGIYDKHLSDLRYSDLSNKLYETNMVF
jgi:very-short-patch-repair endonuclease